jgi:hypothetical protein
VLDRVVIDRVVIVVVTVMIFKGQIAVRGSRRREEDLVDEERF